MTELFAKLTCDLQIEDIAAAFDAGKLPVPKESSGRGGVSRKLGDEGGLFDFVFTELELAGTQHGAEKKGETRAVRAVK